MVSAEFACRKRVLGGVNQVDFARQLLALGSLEYLLTDPDMFALITATPLQRAICRISEGRPLRELASDPVICDSFGCDMSKVDVRIPPKKVYIIGGVRSAKSLFTTVRGVKSTQVVDISKLRRGEVARLSVVSLDKDKADVVYNDHLLGTVRASPILQTIMMGEPKSDSCLLRHPSGQPIEIKVVAGKRAGGSLVSRWSAGVIFDEAPRMVGADEGVVNLEHELAAVESRLLPGAQVVLPGSPWAPFGPVYDAFREHWGKPSSDIVVVRCKGPDMNPVWWTPERCAELKRINPDSYQTDVEAAFLTEDEALLSSVSIERCTASWESESYDPVHTYAAGMDPATRGNSWTLVIARRDGRKRIVACVMQWTGSKAEPLSVDDTMRHISEACARYGVTSVETDQYYVDPIIEAGRRHNLRVDQCHTSEQDKAKRWLEIRAKLVEGEMQLPNNQTFLSDLRRVRRKATQTGVSIHLPVTNDGRHCDYAPAFLLAVCRYLPEPAVRSEDLYARQQKIMFEASKRRYSERANDDL